MLMNHQVDDVQERKMDICLYESQANKTLKVIYIQMIFRIDNLEGN
jgi:ribosomal protein S3AE